MTNLEPCPFCGGEASFKPRSFKTSCNKCGAYVPTGATSSDESIAAWNRRAPSAALIRAEEALDLITKEDRLHGVTPGSNGHQSWHDGYCAAIARAALSEIKKLRGE